MFKTRRILLSLTCILCVATVSYGFVITDFEDDEITPLWRVNDWDTPAGSVSISTDVGVTSGTQCLKMDVPRPGWTIASVLTLDHSDNPDLLDFPDVYGFNNLQEFVDAFESSQTIEMDITIDPCDWPADEGAGDAVWMTIGAVMNSENGGWTGLTLQSDDVNPGTPGGWDPINFPTLQTRHVVWNISDTHAALANGGGGWWELIIFLNSGGFSSGGAVYIDNVQMVSYNASSSPVPANNGVGVAANPILTWKEGALAASHMVYLGTDFNDVNDATADAHANVTTAALDATRYVVPDYLAFDTTYYWRVDEVNGTDVWKGDVWSFTTDSLELIDDFELYKDSGIPGDSRIFETWRDQYEYTNASGGKTPGNGTNMTVGVDTEPYGPETATVYKGSQALPLTYNNAAAPYISETDRTFDTPLDFTTAHDGQAFETLDLQIHGRWQSPGTFTNDGGGQYTVVGSGADIWNAEDQFHYVYQALPGDGSIVAKIESAEATDEWAKVGVMIREGLEADSVAVAAMVTDSGHTQYMYRDVAGASAAGPYSAIGTITLPYWVRLTRSGDIITPEISADGQNWELIENEDPIAIPMYTDVYIGLVVTSHVNAGTPCTAVFSNVEVTGTASSEFTESVDVGLPVNDPANLYVRLEDGSGATATVNHPDDPNAVLNSEYVPFSIPLSEFSDQGLDLTQVGKMVIGVGDGEASGFGKLFVDDIRLTLPLPEEPNEP